MADELQQAIMKAIDDALKEDAARLRGEPAKAAAAKVMAVLNDRAMRGILVLPTWPPAAQPNLGHSIAANPPR